jgi:hypothetical protein
LLWTASLDAGLFCYGRANFSPQKRQAEANPFPDSRKWQACEDEFPVLKVAMKCGGIIAGLLLVLAAPAYSADKIVWKPIPDAILQIDARPVKIWNVFQAGKKIDLLLLQLGARSLVIYVHNREVFEIKPEQLAHKGEDLLWHESDKPAKPLATSNWSTKDVGSAWRVRFQLAAEGRVIDIQIPQIPDLRRGIY